MKRHSNSDVSFELMRTMKMHLAIAFRNWFSLLFLWTLWNILNNSSCSDARNFVHHSFLYPHRRPTEKWVSWDISRVSNFSPKQLSRVFCSCRQISNKTSPICLLIKIICCAISLLSLEDAWITLWNYRYLINDEMPCSTACCVPDVFLIRNIVKKSNSGLSKNNTC